MSGDSGPNWLPPESDSSWQQTKSNLQSWYGGVGTCNSTNIVDNPLTGAGHWYTECHSVNFTCTAAPTTGREYPSNNPSLTCSDCNAKTGKPINLMNGDVWVTEQDYSLPGLGGGITLERTWNSLWPSARDAMPQTGMFGDSWRSTYEEYLLSFGTDYIKYFRANGDGWLFQWNSSASNYQLVTPPNRHATLTQDSTTLQYTITFADGSTRIFGNNGYLITIADRNNN
jgi:hypothetical protein